MARGTIGIGSLAVSGSTAVSGTLDIQGIDSDASASLARPVVIGAKYFEFPQDATGSIDDGDTVVLRTDKSRNLMVSLATAVSGSVEIQGIDSDASASLARPVMIGAKYFKFPQDATGSVDDGDSVILRTDIYRNLMVSLATAIAGENVSANVLEVGEVGKYYAITGSTGDAKTYQVASGSGVLLKLHYVRYDDQVSQLNIQDGLTGSATVPMVPYHYVNDTTMPGNMPHTVEYGLKFLNGLIVDTSGSLFATVVYKVEE